MKRIAIALFAVAIGLGAMVPDAEAKRLGGGKSSGVSRDSSVMKREAVPAKPAAASTQAAVPAAVPAAAAPASGMSRWMGPLAGLAAGIGLAALFSHLGMGEGMANLMMMLLLGLVVAMAVRWFLRTRQPASTQPAMQYAGMPAGMEQPNSSKPLMPGSAAALDAPTAARATTHVPADFDVEGFLRQARLNFIRLQAANDRGDMADIREFCTPEMAAEIQVQFQERNQLVQETNVMQLNAELLDVSIESDWALASVRFSGQLIEEANAGVTDFSEVWHLTRLLADGQGWRIAGIQQS